MESVLEDNQVDQVTHTSPLDMEEVQPVVAEKAVRPLDEKSTVTTNAVEVQPPPYQRRQRAKNFLGLSQDLYCQQTYKNAFQQGQAVVWKFGKFIGPGALISVAYIDPDNYQTAISAGAIFQYKLLFIVLVSNLIAIYLQVRQHMCFFLSGEYVLRTRIGSLCKARVSHRYGSRPNEPCSSSAVDEPRFVCSGRSLHYLHRHWTGMLVVQLRPFSIEAI